MKSICLRRSTCVLLSAGVLSLAGCGKKDAEEEKAEREATLAAYGMLEGKDQDKDQDSEPVEAIEKPLPKESSSNYEWSDLLDPELSKWVPSLGRSAGSDGLVPSDLFSVEQQGDELTLIVSGKALGALTSVKSFKNYHLSLEYKWEDGGSDATRESGLIYHSVGKKRQMIKTWMTGIEFDISETAAGGLYALAGISAGVPSEKINRKSSRYVPGAPVQRIGQKTTIRCLPLEGEHGVHSSWVSIDIYVLGNSARHYVDGDLVLELQDATRQIEGRSSEDLLKGRLQIQAENSKIAFRRIRIVKIDAFPER